MKIPTFLIKRNVPKYPHSLSIAFFHRAGEIIFNFARNHKITQIDDVFLNNRSREYNTVISNCITKPLSLAGTVQTRIAMGRKASHTYSVS